MSHWIKVCKVVPMAKGNDSQSKTSIPNSSDIIQSRRVKQRKEIKIASKGEAPKSFFKACEKAQIPPTRRQLSKWTRGTGLAKKSA